MATDETALQVPAQSIPVPRSISPQGQAYLATAARRFAAQPTRGGVPGLEGLQAQAATAVQFLRPMAQRFRGTIETITLPSGAKLHRVTPDDRTGRLRDVAYFDIHGGGFVSGGGEMCELLAKIRATDYGADVYAVDYRLLPEVYPAGLDDCVAAYRKILEKYDASKLVVGGSSAGGNLAAALLLRARDEGLPMPAALLLLTPGLDLTQSGDSYQTNRFLDVNLHGGAADGLSRYAGTTDPKHSYVSPLFGDFTKGWPPTILTTGTRDLLLSDTVRMHRALRRAGVRAELHVSEAGPHGGFMGSNAPEDIEIMAECRRFLYAVWGVASDR